MMSLLWYYRPEHTQGGRNPSMHQVSLDQGRASRALPAPAGTGDCPNISLHSWVPQAEYSRALLAVRQVLPDVLSGGVL